MTGIKRIRLHGPWSSPTRALGDEEEDEETAES